MGNTEAQAPRDREALTGIRFVLKTGTPWEDRPGVKQYLLVDAGGLPIAGVTTAANVAKVTQLVPLVDAAGPQLPEGGPVHRPRDLYADRGYDSEPLREQLRARGIDPHLAKRRTEHGSGLGACRWVVERTNAWLHGFRKLRFVTEKNGELPFTFFNLGLALIAFRFLHPNAFCSSL